MTIDKLRQELEAVLTDLLQTVAKSADGGTEEGIEDVSEKVDECTSKLMCIARDYQEPNPYRVEFRGSLAKSLTIVNDRSKPLKLEIHLDNNPLNRTRLAQLESDEVTLWGQSLLAAGDQNQTPSPSVVAPMETDPQMDLENWGADEEEFSEESDEDGEISPEDGPGDTIDDSGEADAAGDAESGTEGDYASLSRAELRDLVQQRGLDAPRTITKTKMVRMLIESDERDEAAA